MCFLKYIRANNFQLKTIPDVVEGHDYVNVTLLQSPSHSNQTGFDENFGLEFPRLPPKPVYKPVVTSTTSSGVDSTENVDPSIVESASSLVTLSSSAAASAKSVLTQLNYAQLDLNRDQCYKTCFCPLLWPIL